MAGFASVFLVKIGTASGSKGRLQRILGRLGQSSNNETSTDNSDRHLCVGTDATETLCGEAAIMSAIQIDSFERFDDVCSDCERRFKDTNIDPEPTIECHRCGNWYGASRSRLVPHAGNKVSVCRPCYEDIRDSGDTDVTESYEDATAPMDLELEP